MMSNHDTTDLSSPVGQPVAASTLVELLRLRAEMEPDKVAYTYLVDGERQEVTLTYQELDQQARLIAGELQRLGASGERALLLHPPGLEFISAFWGCLYAGVVAVPAYPPDPTRLERSLPRLQAIIADAQPMVALTTPSLGAMLRLVRSQNPLLKLLTRLPIPKRVGGTFLRKLATVETGELQGLNFVTTNNLSPKRLSEWQMPELRPDTLAYLQYTSGSTGNPKGVMINHANILANLALSSELIGITSQSRVVGWVPLYHDLGLLAYVCGAVYSGFDCVLMSPLHFLQRPLRWLEAISRFKATHNAGPNFGYEYCIRKTTPQERATLDLSHWQVAGNGGEPVRQETVERFVDAFAASGFRAQAFYPTFGMAEAVLYLTATKNKQDPPLLTHLQATALSEGRIALAGPQDHEVQTIVSCGRTGEAHRIVIADPETLRRSPPNRVGEIWFSGPSVAQGYWNRPQASAKTFQAYLADTGEGPFLRTGDLGFLREEELFVTGRLKDMIIIRGRNYYPQDIELTVEQSHAKLRPGCGAAFSIEADNREGLVIVQEVKQKVDEGLSHEIMAQIRRAVAKQHDLKVVAICLLKARSIPKTSSGKIQRRACRAGFLDGSLEVVAEWSDTTVPEKEEKNTTHTYPAKSGTPKSPLKRGVTASTPLLRGAGGVSPRAEAIQAWLVARLAQQLGMAPQEIDLGEPFAGYGLDSMAAVNLSTELADWLGRPLAPTLVYDYPTIAALAQYLATEATLDSAKSSAVPAEHDDREASVEPIAIIGMGCRFPGAESPQAFWELLRDGVDAIREVPAERWDVERFYSSEAATAGKMNTRWGGFLEEVSQFDAHFFGISPREAESMDPQQRLLLEVSWEALQNAHLSPSKLAGSQSGVFIGISSADYSSLLLSHGVDAYFGTGNAASIAANRLSYQLDLRGPSWAVDTACSSSLVAIHQACHSLRQGESELALAGGVNLILTPDVTITFSQARMMAADGRCKTFDAAADGYVRGEGCGVVVLKRLSDAQRDGDQVLALIRGSAVNQDGLSNGLTAPNGPQQTAVIRQALQNAALDPAQISYIEAHGTGTSLGDPIEVEALGQLLSQERENPLMIGSLKTNIGHLEAAAGIAGLIKVVLSLQHQEIPPHLHFNRPNPYISWHDLPITVPTQATPWPITPESRIAGVSSFGFGGTNAHVILSEAPADVIPYAKRTESQGRGHLFTFSAKSQAALLALASRYEGYLEQHPDISLASLCFTANTGRSHLEHRYALIADSSEQLGEQLAAVAAGRETIGVITGQVEQAKPKIAFLFTGQGSQYVEMGRELYETEPTFRAVISRCDEILRATGYLSHSLISVLYSPLGGELLNQTAYTQPALFALEYALVQLWNSWGIEPFAVIGHSVGELVAACVAGVFSLEDGLRLIAARGALMQALPAGGEMVVVRADEARVARALESEPHVAIAAVNGVENTVISGAGEAVRRVGASFSAEGIETRTLQVSHAFHSPLMEPILNSFERIAREVTFHSPQLTLISNLTGSVATDEVTTPAYWARHIRQAVRFADGMQRLHEMDANIFIEIGPKPTLCAMLAWRGMASLVQGGERLPSLRQGRADRQQMLESLAHLYVRGVAVDWDGFYGEAALRQAQGDAYHRLQLPTYPWQRKRYWIERPVGEIVPKKGVVTDYYNSLSVIEGEQIGDFEERFLTFAPFPEPVPGFSWLKVFANPQDHPEHAQMILNAQKEIRQILFEQVDFANVSSVLDFGCGYGSDLIALAEQHQHLKLSGYTISDKQAAIVRQKIEERNLQERISVFTRDSAKHDFPDNYDLVFGFEVTSYIKDKPALFSNISRHLNPGGSLVLADFISNTSFTIEHEETSSYIITSQQWAQWLSEKQLEVVRGVDISPEVANYLYDPNLKENLATITDNNLDVNIKAAVESYNHLVQLLRRHLASYVLLTVRKEEQRSSAELYALNQEKLKALASYADVSLSRWLYDIRWIKQAPPLPVAEAVAPASWLIFADQGGMAVRLAGLLAQRGEHCLIVSAGDSRELVGERHCTINPTNHTDFEWLLQEPLANLSAPLRGVIHLWALEDSPSSELTVTSLAQATERGSGSVLHLVQALNKLKHSEGNTPLNPLSRGDSSETPLLRGDLGVCSSLPSEARLWVVTRGAVAVANGNESLAVASRPLWGLGKVIAVEYPALWGGMFDLAGQAGEDSDEEAQASALLAEISAPSGEDQLAWRNGQAYVARFVRSTYQTKQAFRLSPSGSYLITGGLGALGLLMARFLAAQGASDLLLLGRSGIKTPLAEQTISQLEEAGVKVQVIQADVANVQDMERLFDMLALTEPPLRGIIHAAGLFAYHTIEKNGARDF